MPDTGRGRREINPAKDAGDEPEPQDLTLPPMPTMRCTPAQDVCNGVDDDSMVASMSPTPRS